MSIASRAVNAETGVFIFEKIMKRIELCPCGFEPTTERSIQAARVMRRMTSGVEQARVGSAGERVTLGHSWCLCMRARVAGAGRGAIRTAVSGGGAVVQQVSFMARWCRIELPTSPHKKTFPGL